MKAYINQNCVQGYCRTIRRYYKSLTFTSNGTFLVPNETEQLTVDCVAAQGNGGAKGGRVQCVLKTTPGQTLYIVIGLSSATYNASDIRTESSNLSSRLIVAGGGGFGSYAGAGGGLTGGHGSTSGYNSGGGGGTQSAGGAGSYLTGGSPRGGSNGTAGSLGYGGTGWTRGGAGYYGGGGGSSWDISKVGVQYGGSGGGSSYTHATLCSSVTHTQGYRSGNGYISLNYEVAEGESYDYYVDEVFTKLVRNR